MERPALPDKVFSGRCPTLKELKQSARHKSNKASPGFNAIPYIVYKKCPAILNLLHKIVCKIWKSRDIPDSWAVAFIVLLSKSDNLDEVSKFRPIAITCTVGKIFFSVLSERLQSFMVKNNYIPREIQKGFISGMPGCLEHAFALHEALRDATENKRQIVTTWIDLANAYGSVRHNLIQFALDWYHVPSQVQELIFTYYEKLMAKVVTKEWSTDFFLFDIGLFQGCVLSTILFDCVFQLLLDYLRPIQHLGYSHKSVLVTCFEKAYADDLNLTTKNPKDNQIAVNRTNVWLKWTITSSAKPIKCISLAFRQFDPRTESSKYIPYSDTKYTAYDPLLTIDGHPIQFIANPSIDGFKGKHFKFLGRWIQVLLRGGDIQVRVRSLFQEDINIIEKSKVNGLMKLWLYQFYVLAHLSWPFLVQDFPLSFALELEKSVSVRLKKWAGIYRSADVGLLFRSRKLFGLGLTSVSAHLKHMQVIRCSLLKYSVDDNIRLLYEHREEKEASIKGFRGSKLHTVAENEVYLNQLFPTQDGRAGLGSGKFIAHPTKAGTRKMVVSCVRKQYGS